VKLRPIPILLACIPLLASPVRAAESIRLVDQTALSPDGRTLVLAWRGDLWSVPSEGGAARRITFHDGSDGDPAFSPDGESIAFVSDRTGSRQIHVIPAGGGAPEQITTHTEGHGLEGWFPDGESFLVRASRDHFWRRAQRFFRQPRDDRQRPELLFDDYGEDGSLSPDGRRLLFTREGTRSWRKRYSGAQASQVWLFDLDSGEFRKLTDHDRGERHPLWAPDGVHFYTVSQESGAFNLWRRNLETGEKTRITFFEEDGVHDPCISADGSTLVFRRLFDLYRLRPDAGGQAERIDVRYEGDPWIETTIREEIESAADAAFTDDAREIALIAGGDLWVMDTELREPVRVTHTPDEERDPVFSSDFRSLFFVSDDGGQCDLWRATRADEEAYWWQQTEFRLERLTNDPEPESGLRVTPDGRLAYTRLRGDLWLMDQDGKNARKILSSWNAPQYDFSPDGKWITYAVQDDHFNRDVWIAPIDGGREPFNLSRHPDNESQPVWSPDGKRIAFTGRRWQDETDLYYVYLTKKEDQTSSRDRKLEKAIEKMKKRKGAKKKEPKAGAKRRAEPENEPGASSAGDPVSGTWGGTFTGPEPPLPPGGLPFTLTLRLGEGGAVTGTIDVPELGSVAIEGGRFDAGSSTLTFAVESPEGRSEIRATITGETLSGEWALGPVQGRVEATRTAAAPAREAPASAATEPEGTAEEKEDLPEVVIDFDGLPDRIRRVSIPDSTESSLLWSPDSKKLAFRATVKGVGGLYTITFPDKLTPKLLSSAFGSGARWLEEGNQIVWLSGGRPASVSASGKATRYDFSARHEVDRGSLYRAAFDQAWRIMRDRYYDERLGNNNWAAIGRKYRDMAQRCGTLDELATVVNFMLGELNGSHLGFRAFGGRRRGSSPEWREVTGHLGARYDETHLGPGIRVEDVIDETPASLEKSRLHPGDVILAIDGTPVDPSLNLAAVLTGPPDRDVTLRVRSEEGEERTVTIRPTTYGIVRRRLYETWIARNAEHVDEQSAGRLAYLHVRGMNWPSFERFQEELYKVGHGKDGLVIDVRENGGGFTTDHLLTSLTQPVHAITVPRGGGRGYPHDRMVYAVWRKPVVVLCNQNSFSNAEIFSHAIKTLGRGRLVGVPTAGGVISTGGTSILGLASLRLPFRGWFLLDGQDMELNGCEPHFIVWPEPGEIPAGIDRQLDKAIEVCLEDVAAYEARERPELIKASER